jgi:hypothetical protein
MPVTTRGDPAFGRSRRFAAWIVPGSDRHGENGPIGPDHDCPRPDRLLAVSLRRFLRLLRRTAARRGLLLAAEQFQSQ